MNSGKEGENMFVMVLHIKITTAYHVTLAYKKNLTQFMQ